MYTYLSKILPLLVFAAALIVFGCNSSANDGEEIEPIPPPKSVPTAANDGLVAVDIGDITATDFVTAGSGTASREEENISVEVPAGATIQRVFLYWARVGSESSPAASTILVNGTTVTGEILGGPVDVPNDNFSAITHRADITGSEIISAGSNTFSVQDNPQAPAEPLGASVLVFYRLDGEEESVMSLFHGIDFAFEQATGSNSELEEALQNCVPRTFIFDAADVEREAELTFFVGDIEPVDAAERPNSLRIEIGDLATQQIGPFPNPFQGSQGAEWDNYTMSITIPAGVETVTVFPVSGPRVDNEIPASLVWSLAGLSIQQSP